MKKFLKSNITNIHFILTSIIFFIGINSLWSQKPQSANSEAFELAENYTLRAEDFYYSKSQRDLDSCLFYNQKAVEIYKTNEAWSEYIAAMNTISSVYHGFKEYQKFHSTQDSIVALADKHLAKDDRAMLLVYLNASTSARMKSNYSRAIEFAQLALTVPLEKEDSYKVLRPLAYSNLGTAHTQLGNYDEAIEYASISLEKKLAKKSNNKISLATAYHKLAYAYQQNKDYDTAIENYKIAEKIYSQEIAKETADQKLYRTWIQLALAYEASDQLDNAQNINNKLKLNESNLSSSKLADYYILNAYLELKKENKNYDAIIKLLEDANQLIYKSFSSKQSNKLSSNLYKIGETCKEAGYLEKAKVIYLAALDSLGSTPLIENPEELEYKISTLNILQGLMDLALEENNYESVSIRSKQALGIIDVLGQQNASADHKLFWANKNLSIIEKAIQAEFRLGNKEKAFQYLEKNKSNLLTYKLNQTLAKGYANIDQNILAQENKLQSDILYLKNQIRKLTKSESKLKLLMQEEIHLTKENESSLQKIIESKANLKSEKVKLQSELNLLLRNLEKNYPDYHKIKYDFTPTKLDDITSMLDKNSAFTEYFIGEEKSFVFLITDQDIVINEVENFSDKRDQLIEFYNALSDSDTKYPESTIKKLALESYQQLIPKQIDSLLLDKSIENLIIVPDDILTNFPFHLLVNHNNDFLFKEYNILYQYSGKLWRLLSERKHTHNQSDLIAFAYNSGIENYSAKRSCFEETQANLRCGIKEINAISKIITGKEYENFDVSKNELFSQAASTKIFHLATHACADHNNPELSTIYFNDGHYTNIDLQNTQVNADLVVLSACESGYGKVHKGEGTMSIAKGFFHAGCKSALVSLWPIDDCTTSDLMTYFYTHLKDGKRKDESLRLAQLDYLEHANPLRTHPYYWSGFILVGDPTPIYASSILSLPVVITSLVIVFFLAIIGYKKMSRK